MVAIVPELPGTTMLDGGLLLASFGMFYVLGALVAGPLHSSVGNMRLMLISLTMLFCGVVVMFASSDYWALFVARLLMGMAS